MSLFAPRWSVHATIVPPFWSETAIGVSCKPVAPHTSTPSACHSAAPISMTRCARMFPASERPSCQATTAPRWASEQMLNPFWMPVAVHSGIPHSAHCTTPAELMRWV